MFWLGTGPAQTRTLSARICKQRLPAASRGPTDIWPNGQDPIPKHRWPWKTIIRSHCTTTYETTRLLLLASPPLPSKHESSSTTNFFCCCCCWWWWRSNNKRIHHRAKKNSTFPPRIARLRTEFFHLHYRRHLYCIANTRNGHGTSEK